MLLTAAFSGPAAQAGAVAFTGTLEANEDYRLLGDPPFLFFVDGAGTADTSEFGQLTWVYSDLVAFSDVKPLTTPGRTRFIAANGDNLFTTHTAISIPTNDPNVSKIVERHIVTGGTGQFDGAQGKFTIRRVVMTENQEVLYGTTKGSFQGTICLKENH